MTTSAKKTVSGMAKEALKHFSIIQRASVKDGQSSGDNVWVTDLKEQWLTDLCHEAHGDKLPDNWCYQFIHEALDAISETDNYEDIDLEADIYTNDLTKWLHSRVDRVYYLTQALEELEPKDGFQALAYAQYLEKREVLDSVKQSLEALVK